MLLHILIFLSVGYSHCHTNIIQVLSLNPKEGGGGERREGWKEGRKEERQELSPYCRG